MVNTVPNNSVAVIFAMQLGGLKFLCMGPDFASIFFFKPKTGILASILRRFPFPVYSQANEYILSLPDSFLTTVRGRTWGKFLHGRRRR